MKRLIRKNVSDVRPGDVLAFPSGSVIVVAIGARRIGGYPELDALVVDPDEGRQAAIAEMHLAGEVEVEAPDQLVTQEQLDMLLTISKTAIAGCTLSGNALAQARSLLDELRPPSPPTLEEALEALEGATQDMTAWREVTSSILDRARRSGILKNG